jgi:hypothetical protein
MHISLLVGLFRVLNFFGGTKAMADDGINTNFWLKKRHRSWTLGERVIAYFEAMPDEHRNYVNHGEGGKNVSSTFHFFFLTAPVSIFYICTSNLTLMVCCSWQVSRNEPINVNNTLFVFKSEDGQTNGQIELCNMILKKKLTNWPYTPMPKTRRKQVHYTDRKRGSVILMIYSTNCQSCAKIC